MASSHTVQDSVNKYRHGVLVGNFAQEQFGIDSVNRGRQEAAPLESTMKASYKLENSAHRFHPIISSEDKRTQTFYGMSGSRSSDIRKEPQKQTTYNIFYRQEFPRRVPIIPNDCKKQERLDKQKQLFDFTKSQFEATSFRKTTGKFHYRKSQNDPNLEEANKDDQNLINGSKIGGGGDDDDLDGDGNALSAALKNQRNSNEQPSFGFGNNKIGPIRAKSLNPNRLDELLAKAQASRAPKKQMKAQQDHLKLDADESEGQLSHILFGHGLTTDKFHERQFVTTYDLSFNQKIKPKTQIDSFFKPDMTKTAKQFHRQTLYEKEHQIKIPEFNTKNQLYNDKLCRPYAPYTKTFDQNHMKSVYLRK